MGLVSSTAFSSPVLYRVAGDFTLLAADNVVLDDLGVSFSDKVIYEFIIDTERNGFYKYSNGSIYFIEDDASHVNFFAELITTSYNMTRPYNNRYGDNYVASNITPEDLSSESSVFIGPDTLHLKASSYIQDWQLGDSFDGIHYWDDDQVQDLVILKSQLTLTKIEPVPLPSSIILFMSSIIIPLTIKAFKKRTIKKHNNANQH